MAAFLVSDGEWLSGRRDEGREGGLELDVRRDVRRRRSMDIGTVLVS